MTSQALWPATVAALNRGLVSRAGLVSLIGTVEREVPGNAYLDFVLNDCTGRVSVRYFFPRGRFWLLPEFEGRYVSVVGRVSSTTPPYIITEGVALVEDLDDLPQYCEAFVLIHIYIYIYTYVISVFGLERRDRSCRLNLHRLLIHLHMYC